MKPEGEAADANRRLSQPGGRSNNRRKPEVEPAEPKDGADASRRLIVGLAGGRIVRRESKRIATGRSEARNSRCKSEVRSRSSRTIQRRSEPGSWPPVEPESRAADESRGFSIRRSHEDATASESWRVGRWGSRRMQHRLYCEFIKIETPGASVSGVFNLRRFFAAVNTARGNRPVPAPTYTECGESRCDSVLANERSWSPLWQCCAVCKGGCKLQASGRRRPLPAPFPFHSRSSCSPRS